MILIGIAERKEREKEEMRKIILNAAYEIIKRDGVEKISVRKIAAKIEYSPAIIYHYFENKDEIVEKLIAEQYVNMVKALSVLQVPDKKPEEKLKACNIRFIKLAAEMGDLYKSLMMNGSPNVLARTSVLQKGASAMRPAVAMLCSALRELPAWTDCEDADIELTAQIIWSTAFGLSMRLIVEQVEEEQKQRLINRAGEFILQALENGPQIKE